MHDNKKLTRSTVRRAKYANSLPQSEQSEMTRRTDVEASEERLRLALASGEMGVWQTDIETGEKFWGDRIALMLGIPAQDVERASKHWTEFIHPEDRARVVNALQTAGKNGVTRFNEDFRVLRADGSLRWFASRGRLVRVRGKQRRMVGIVTDITDRKHAQRQLEIELAATQLLQQLSAELVHEANIQALYDKIVGAAVKIMRSDFASFQMLHPERGNGELQLLAFHKFTPEAAKTWEWVSIDSKGTSCGKALHVHERVVVKDVEECEYVRGTPALATFRQTGIRSCQTTPLVSREGKLVGMISTHWRVPHEPSERDLRFFDILARQAADLLERRAVEQALRESERLQRQLATDLEAIVAERTAKLQETVNDLQSFSYSIAHDMRAPLRAMGTFAQLLKDEVYAGNAPGNANVFCDRIVIGAARLDNLINDALNYTKAVLREVPVQPVELSKLVRGLLDTYPNLHGDYADIRIEGNLPTVLGNEAFLTQCFSNLLGNAVKFVAPGVRPKVRVWSEANDGMARIFVEDNGIGIPKHAQPRLFAMFQKLDNQYEGTGIGLAIVRRVVERMGGKVGVDSEPGRGSRFWVDLRVPPKKENL